MKQNVDIEKIVKEVLARKDPAGYYVIVAVNSTETQKIIEKYSRDGNLFTEVVGDLIVVRSKARKIVEKLVRALVLKNLLASI